MDANESRLWRVEGVLGAAIAVALGVSASIPEWDSELAHELLEVASYGTALALFLWAVWPSSPAPADAERTMTRPIPGCADNAATRPGWSRSISSKVIRRSTALK